MLGFLYETKIRSGWSVSEFQGLGRKSSKCSIKVIRSDNGTEYTSDKFDRFCVEAGIVHQLIVTYSHQQNGVSERKNRAKWI